METKAKLPKRRKLYEYFIAIGINNDYLDAIEEDRLLMNPQVIASFPETDNGELKLYYSYKTFCYHEGVNVTRYHIDSEEKYMSLLLESNLYSNPIESFCFIKPSNYETKDNQKYLFGFKFYDMHIIKSKANDNKHNSMNVFKYEKVFLLVSTQPSFQVFEAFFAKILEIKKLNYLNHLTQFTDIYDRRKFDAYVMNNNELKNKDIIDLLHYGNVNNFSKTLSYLASSNRTIDTNESNLAWLLRKIMGYINPKTFYIIMLMVFSEQPVLFYGDNIELITFTTIAFSLVILPFVWKFPLIPNLPFDSIHMATSPVPFLLGIIGTKEQIVSFTGGVSCNMVNVSKSGIKVTMMMSNDNEGFDLPGISQLNSIIDLIFWELNGKDKQFKENIPVMKEIAINAAESITEGINKIICERIQKASMVNGNIKQKSIRDNILSIVHQHEYKFFEQFTETEMFMSYCDSLRSVTDEE